MDDVKQFADDWANKTLARLKEHSLFPNPENFAVFYYYYAGKNPALKIAIDQQGDKLSNSICAELYVQHLGIEAEQKSLRETNAAIEKELQHVMAAIGASAKNSQNFNQTLTNVSGELEKPLPLEDIKKLVARMAQETRAVAEQNDRLQQQLSASTQQLTELKTNLDEVKKESLIDPLTEVGNRKYFNNELVRIAAEASENGVPLALLVIDIDFFKKFNDTHGHLVGDQVLRLVGRTLKDNIKGRDIVARYGGEEFVVMLPYTKIADAEKVANHLRTTIGQKKITRRNTQESLGAITFSVGVTEYNPGEDLEGFIGRADAALYRAKQAGRNCVKVEYLTAANPFGRALI
jgi:diguanylate cyclase